MDLAVDSWEELRARFPSGPGAAHSEVVRAPLPGPGQTTSSSSLREEEAVYQFQSLTDLAWTPLKRSESSGLVLSAYTDLLKLLDMVRFSPPENLASGIVGPVEGVGTANRTPTGAQLLAGLQTRLSIRGTLVSVLTLGGRLELRVT